MYELVIIGGGPAGITAGIYAARKKIKTLLITKDFLGQAGLTGIIENWPGEKKISGPDLMRKFEDHLKEHDIDIKEGEQVFSLKKKKRFVVSTEWESIDAKAVIVATGRRQKRLGVRGEKELTGKGVVYCTTCDAPLFKNKSVVVAGGGNAGFEAAIELTDHAKKVFLFEGANDFSADEFLQEQAKERGVELYTGRTIEEIKGDNFVEEVIYNDAGNKDRDSMKTEGVFVQIGSVAINDFLDDELVDFDKNGDIMIDQGNCFTKTEGLLAAGDVTNTRDKQIIVSSGEGAKATLSLYEYLKRK